MTYSKSKKPPLKPRDEIGTVGFGFSMPHRDFYEEAHRLFELMKQASAAALNASVDDKSRREGAYTHIPYAAWDVSMLARAVEIFSALAVEAAINCYGLVRYGHEQFEGRLGNKPLVVKLRGVLEPISRDPLSDDDELLILVKRVAARRNELVHPRSDESRMDESGKMDYVTPVQESGTPELAFESLSLMVRFFELFPHRDRLYGHWIAPVTYHPWQR
ncbi:MAG TPA: hypothetical protein VII66_05645 [Gemmatimonadaceae bacterium]|jgi:hypothetical protein